MARRGLLLVSLLGVILISFKCATSQVLTPPYFNLAVGRTVESTATCGEGVDDAELYCKLTGANPGYQEGFSTYNVIQGQLCDYCDRNIQNKSHPADFAIDGTTRWWQSPPLSRGLQFNQVNLTVHLGQEFHVAYVFIKMGNAPRPGVFALERSVDNGVTWKPWQYFADTMSDCEQFFGDSESGYTDRIEADDSVVCTTDYSKVVPLEGGEIVVSLVNNRPSANNFSYAQTLQDWTKATAVRLRLLRTKTLLGHLMAVARQDPTVTRRYFYSIKDISIGGRCVCNGHAESCDKTNPDDQYRLLCRCRHNTCGPQCNVCCAGFVQKPWQPATLNDANECEPCNCHGHSSECVYDEGVAARRESLDKAGRFEGGGVCQNCRDHTEGINCQLCKVGFFRLTSVSPDTRDACQPCSGCDLTFSTGDCQSGTGRCICRPEYSGERCDMCNVGYFGWPRCQECECNVEGTLGQVCEVGGGQCPCKPSYKGQNCNQCAYGYYGFPECKPCGCDSIGAASSYCDVQTGQCQCNPNYGGRDCADCAMGYYGYPACQLCNCDPSGCDNQICDPSTGTCSCEKNYGGLRCDRCNTGFYRHPFCNPCECSQPGSQSKDCENSGQCMCDYNFSGIKCDRCAPGYYKYPECLACNCDTFGSYGVTCSQQNGQCDCRETFEGVQCNSCKANFFNYPNCEKCNCNPAGAKKVEGYPTGGCGIVRPGTLCECKDRVNSKFCDECNAGYWNLQANNPDGCESCGCQRSGATGSQVACSSSNGQCQCRPYVQARQCDTCMDGTYNLQDYNVFGCQDCGCDSGGALDHRCDKDSGACRCRPRINGRRCDMPLNTHYVPTLYQHRYEMEDGRTPEGGPVRYGFDQGMFPDYSWRGFAIFSTIQDEVHVDVDIKRPSLYRLVFRFVNSNPESIKADVFAQPEASSSDVDQTSTVLFQPTGRTPQFVTVAGGGYVTTFVLNPGRWTISLKTDQRLLVDYLVLLPQHYYEASVLQDRVNRPCTVPGNGGLCKHFTYVDVATFPSARGEDGYVEGGGSRDRTQLYPDRDVSQELGTSNMAYLDIFQRSVTLDLYIPRSTQYVLFVQYHSPAGLRTQTCDVSVDRRGRGPMPGTLTLHACPYSSLCRQVLVDARMGDAILFDLEQGTYQVTLTGTGTEINAAIEGIVAVPTDQWDLNIIQPQLKCVRRDMQCIESDFLSPTGSVRVEVEAGPNEDRVSDDIPPSIINTGIRVIKLDQRAPSVNVKASVINPGPYAFVVHYFQPYVATINVYVELLIDNVPFKGEFDARYCPGVSGCRARVTFPDLNSNILDLSDLDFLVSFNNTSGRPVWLDYIMVIPAVQYRPDVLDSLPVDKSAEFIKECGSEDFFISESTAGFCRDGVFSLTTDYNNGALNCDCNIDGSTNFNCAQFGGQCNCKPDVIGRKCSQCRTGYYGFPNCRPCNCPSGLCDPKSGQCVCPPRVTGNNCNVCLPRTFGFDPLIGCEECRCDPQGVMNNNLECDITTGQCSCKANIGGRRCDECVAGYSFFPSCVPCSCDRKGSTEDVCDQDSARCLCKDNAQGVQCSQCKPETFYLEDRNPNGCTQCFCFGHTTNCQSSNLRREQEQDMRGWGITNLKNARVETYGNKLISNVRDNDRQNPGDPIYWVAPLAYLGNKVTSYGGNLIYTVAFRLPAGGDSSGTVFSDVKIEGSNMTIVHQYPEQPFEDDALTVVLDMVENKFFHEATGERVAREQFMMVLSYIEALQIRASYYSRVSQVSLSDVTLDIATERGTGALARNVEQCRCSANYAGTSCETCAPGYYRSKVGPYLGVCVPCRCNGRADICHPDTGQCVNCRDNYGGPECLTCKPGYFVDRTGSCAICHCPMPIESNNFAETCSQRSNGLYDCQCKKGYTGRQCDTCDLGYWGNPTVLGGECFPCDCSGNINIDDPTSCDPLNGQCLKCVDNTSGEKCERCQPGYYGDAIDLKNCMECECNTVGTEECDHQTGNCRCRPGVTGNTCDRCMRGMFGFESGRGCDACDCAEGSNNFDCDIVNGQCTCQPGVTGRRCDQCEQGYWSYGPLGCDKCECESDGATTCDPRSGKCQCLPGVTGPKCDMCLPRWVLVPEKGCQECDSCIDILLDDLDTMNGDMTTMLGDLDSVSVGVGAIRRLDSINASVAELRPRVDGLIGTPQDSSFLDPLKKDLQELEEDATQTRKRGDKLSREADLVELDAAATRRDAEALGPLVDMAVDAGDGAVKFAQEIMDEIINSKEASDLENLLRQAEGMLDELKDRDFTQAAEDAEMELDKAVDALNNARSLQDQAMEQANRTRDLGGELMDIAAKLRDLNNNSRHALDNAQAANDLNSRNQQLKDRLLAVIADISDNEATAKQTLEDARALLDAARQFLGDARLAYDDVSRELSRLDPATDDLRDFVDDLTSENLELRPLVDNATEHARKLRQQAQFLDNMIADTRESAEGALNASNAYRAIVDAINTALNASSDANTAADKALDLSNGLATQALESLEKSKELKSEADLTEGEVASELEPRLADAIAATDKVENLNLQIQAELDKLNNGLEQLPEGGYGDQARDAAEKAEDAQLRASASKDKIQSIVDELPEDLRKVEQIPFDISEANNNVDRAQGSVDKVLELVPDATALLDKLDTRTQQIMQLGEDLTQDIMALRERIGLARGEANRIRVGMKFYSNTTLQLRNPTNLMSAGSFSKLSVYFRTDQENGFLAYVGPDGRTMGSLKTEDYMALEIIDGRVVFSVDLGKGPGIVTSNILVSDGMWHHAIAERMGRNMKLIVRTADEPDSEAEGLIDGDNIVLDLDPTYTRFYAGGVPADANLINKVTNLRFRGCLEDVEFDGVPVGLWNFVSGENNKDGCEARDGLEVAAPNGFRFDGNGYVVMPKDRFNPKTDTTVAFRFRTFAENGLLVLMGDSTKSTFLSVELRDGRVLFKYDLGSGASEIITEQGVKFNDGKWHSVSARRINKGGMLRINDGEYFASGQSQGLQRSLDITDEIHVGGYKGTHNFPGVTDIPFRGCIERVQLGSTVRDMNNNLFAYNVQPGCVETARSLSFVDMGSDDSYIAMNVLDAAGNLVTVDSNYEMTMKFKSENEDGLLFYISDDQQSQQNALSVSVVKGKINAVATVDGVRTVLESNRDQYNDGRWHYIHVSKKNRAIQLNIDDQEDIRDSYEGRRRMTTTSYLYFGGLPFRPLDDNVGSSVSYVGCIGDVTVNGSPLNFDDATEKIGIELNICPIPDPTPAPAPPPVPLVTLPPPTPSGEDTSRCVLPERPVLGPVDPASGTRFGLAADSRWEYDNGKDAFRSDGTWQVEFKTTAPDGIIMYVADARQTDFVALYVKDGFVVYGYNLGDNPALISSTDTYNDGLWHTVAFSRNQLDGTLTVDGTDQNTGSAAGRSQFINVEMPYYVGGVTGNIVQGVAKNLEGLTMGLAGCLRNLQHDNTDVGAPDRIFKTEACSANTETGAFFGADGGYVQLADNVVVDLDLDINLEIKPRSQNGVIISVIGQQGDFLVLQMLNGELLFSMDNGAGEVMTIWKPTLRGTLCNGEWHTVKCQKAKNVVTLEVDGVFGSPGAGEPGVSRTDTNDPFYVGGVPVRHRGIKTVANFIGCIRNLEFGEGRPQNLALGTAEGDVNINSCPTN